MEYKKFCTKCLIEKDFGSFGKDPKGRAGLTSRCKSCMKIIAKIYRDKNIDKNREYSKKYKEIHKEDILKKGRIRYLNNIENERQRSLDYYNSSHGRKIRDDYQQNNKITILEKKKKDYIENKDIVAAKLKEKRKKNPEVFRQRSKNRKALKKNNGNGEKVSLKDWEYKIIQYKYCCAYCDKHQDECGKLEQDHIIPLTKNGPHTIENIVPSCKSCNSSKGNKSLEEFIEFKNKLKKINDNNK